MFTAITAFDKKKVYVDLSNHMPLSALEDLLVSCTGKYATGDEVYLVIGILLLSSLLLSSKLTSFEVMKHCFTG